MYRIIELIIELLAYHKQLITLANHMTRFFTSSSSVMSEILCKPDRGCRHCMGFCCYRGYIFLQCYQGKNWSHTGRDSWCLHFQGNTVEGDWVQVQTRSSWSAAMHHFSLSLPLGLVDVVLSFPELSIQSMVTASSWEDVGWWSCGTDASHRLSIHSWTTEVRCCC